MPWTWRKTNVAIAIASLAFLIPTVWEWIALKWKLFTSFKYVGNLIITNVRIMWEWFGQLFARLTALIELIGIKEFLMGAEVTLKFYSKLFLSWWWFFVGYFGFLETVDYPMAACAIALLIVTTLLFFIMKWLLERSAPLVFRDPVPLFIGIVSCVGLVVATCAAIYLLIDSIAAPIC